jgi:SAM-dependent methyltransferase/alkylhydroperoxidase family enzyme
LSEPSNCREYVALHHLLEVDGGDRLLDVACGSGLAIELARLRGALCAGIDASARLVAVAQFRSPDCDIRVGDMHDLPWEDDAFDVVTSFRGIWGTTPDAVNEIYRVLRPGGRIGLTVWGHIKVSPGAWALAPFRLAAEEKVDNQAAMVSLGRPGAGESLLETCGFVDTSRVDVPFAWEFADLETFARALASSGPAYEAIQKVGEQAFHDAAADQAREHSRDQCRRLPGPQTQGGPPAMTAGFLEQPTITPEAQALFDEDVKETGYLWNGSRLWAYQPETVERLFELMSQAFESSGLDFRQRAILVVSAASALGDSYCSLAWGGKLSGRSDPTLAAGVVKGTNTELTSQEKAMATWARKVVKDPNATTPADVQNLRDAGLSDTQIFAITAFVALRMAFSTINDALGASPDAQLVAALPPAVTEAVTFGRPPDFTAP